MHSALCGSQNVGQIFDGACAQQYLPVRAAGGEGEGAGHQQQVGTRLRVRPVQLRKAQVVADRQAHAPRRSVAGRHGKANRLAAGRDHVRLVEMLAAIVEAKQVNLVVARDAFTLGRIHQRGVEHMVVTGRAQGQRAAHNPQPQLTRRGRQKLLNAAVSRLLAQRQLVGVALAHDAEILGQGRQLRAFARRLLQQGACCGEVGIERDARHHLNSGYFHCFSPAVGLEESSAVGSGSSAFFAASEASLLRLATRSTRGSDQVPSMRNSCVAA